MVIFLMSILITSIVFHGCVPLIQINMVQRSIIDDGDGSTDQFTKLGDKRLEAEETDMELIVPLK